VDIWRCALVLSGKTLESLETTLSDDEKQRAVRFHFQADKDRFVASHGCLRDILQRYLHCEPGQLHFSSGPHGKPELDDHRLDFNLSHSGDFALVAITQGRKVGVDVERIRRGISFQAIARQFFSKFEVDELFALPSEEWESGFFTCWTRKEAYIKGQGLGLSLPLESFDVSPIPNGSALLRATRPDPDEAARWMLLSPEVDSRYASAVAVGGQSLEFRFWDWDASWE
jgi:4'-phosphopantetheinyl transferase